MAERLAYDVKPTRTTPTAQEELQRLLETLHEHGVLRLANDLVGANAQILQVLMSGLNNKGSLNAIQNLSILLMALSRIQPADFYRQVFALAEAFAAADRENTAAPEDAQSGQAPGLTGAYHLLQDEELWAAIRPILRALRAYAQHAHQKVEKPISAFTGKDSEA